MKLKKDHNKGCYGDEFVVPVDDVVGVVKHASDGSLISDYDEKSINTNNNNNNEVSLYENDSRDVAKSSERRFSIIIKHLINTDKKDEEEEEEEMERKVSVNGRRVKLDGEVSFHRNMKFEHGELMTTELRDVLMGGRDATCQQGVDLKHNVVCGLEDNNLVCKLVPKSKKDSESDTHKLKSLKSGLSSKSFKEVVSNVLKTEAIIKYMEKLRHRSESESDEEEDYEDGLKSCHQKNAFKSLIEKTNMGSKKKCLKTGDSCNSTTCDNVNNNNALSITKNNNNNKNNNNINKNKHNNKNNNKPDNNKKDNLSDEMTNEKLDRSDSNSKKCDTRNKNVGKNKAQSKTLFRNNPFSKGFRSKSSDVDVPDNVNSVNNNKRNCIIQ